MMNAPSLAPCCIIALLGLTAANAEEYPSAEISNKFIRVKLMLPEAEHGSYRSTRFDWSGIIASLQFSGHEYFGQWYEHHDPKIHDAITGPVEEFRTNEAGPGYDEALPGGTFMRVGVGLVRKPDEKTYNPYTTYEITEPGRWTVHTHRDKVEYTQRLSFKGYAYLYRKTVRLVKDKPELVIEHSLNNTGTRALDSTVYDHNFFVIDHEVVGPDMAFIFHFTPQPVTPLQNGVEVHGQEIRFTQELGLKKGEGVFTELKGYGNDAADYDIRLENRKSGAGVRIRGNRPMVKLNFWGIRSVVCPEPYLHLQVEPGQETHWRYTYDFYTIPPAAGTSDSAAPRANYF